MTRLAGVVSIFLLLFGMNGSAYAEYRIIGGEDAVEGQQDWVVPLVIHSEAFVPGVDLWYSYQFCGGTLVDHEWVLTAAHCVYDLDADEIDIVIDIHDLMDVIGIPVPVEYILYHPSYDESTSDYDLAILKLDITGLDASELATLNAITPKTIRLIMYAIEKRAW